MCQILTDADDRPADCRQQSLDKQAGGQLDVIQVVLLKGISAIVYLFIG